MVPSLIGTAGVDFCLQPVITNKANRNAPSTSWLVGFTVGLGSAVVDIASWPNAKLTDDEERANDARVGTLR